MKVYVNGTQAAISPEKIVIYGSGKILYQIESSSFEVRKLGQNANGETRLESGYNLAPIAIYLEKPIKTARKENLNRTDNYTLPFKVSYMSSWIRTALYIHESEIAVEDLGNVLAMETDEEKNYLHAVRLSFKNPIVVNNYHIEAIPCGNSWTIPDGGKWSTTYGTAEHPCYDPYDNSKRSQQHNDYMKKRHADYDPTEKGVIKRWITEEKEENAVVVAVERYYTKSIYSDERLRKDAVADALNKSGLFGKDHFSHYDIDKLEKVLGRLTIAKEV